MIEQTRWARFRHDRPHPARPLHRGHLPDLRLSRGARRPVRQLRQPARPGRPDQPALEDRRRSRRCSGRPSISSSTCRPSRSAGANGSAKQEHWRPNVRELLARACWTSCSRARSRATWTGACRSRCRVRGARRQAHLRLVRRRDRLPLGSVEWAHDRGTPDAWRDWWQNPEARHYYFMGKDNIVFHTRDLAEQLMGYGEGRRGRRRARRRSTCPTTSSQRVPDHGGQEVQQQPRHRHLCQRLLEPLRPRPAALLPDGRPGRRRRTPTSPGPSSCAATTTSWWRPGATWSTAR